MKTRYIIVSLLMLLMTMMAQAQISIGGNVYGGGNAGDTGGNTTVTVYAGEINSVFGGACMANVGGHAFVNLDGRKASADILITNVYGGNDISGTIGQGTTIPAELENVKTDASSTDPTKNAIDNSWSAFVRTSPCETKRTVTIEGTEVTADETMLVIGSLFGGGNGEYTYKDENGNDLKDGDNFIVRDADGNIVATSKSPFNKPELAKTYLELKGGCIAHAYGGGNNATVTEATTINIDNTSDDLQKAVTVWAAANKDMLDANGETINDVITYLINKVKLPTFQSNLTSFSYNFSRVFGGNNKADMDIRPKWNLQNGIIRDLYSGGNEGRMIHRNGLLLEIGETSNITVQNVYGGCRKADVRPMEKKIDGTYVDVTEVKKVEGYNFPKNFAARLIVKGGNITNIYGGNDIKGRVYFGNAIGLNTSIKGDLYGGGNGSYAFTDNNDFEGDPNLGDFYYDPKGNSVQALNDTRPNAEQVSIHVIGTKDNPTIIRGSIYCGGNSATLKKDLNKVNNSNYPGYPIVELKMGSYVIADEVFLGNNGKNMVTEETLKYYAGKVDANGEVTTGNGTDFSSLDLTDSNQFKAYMEGCAMDMIPTFTFDDPDRDGYEYEPYSSKIGSLFCGGNVGSMTYEGTNTMDFNVPAYIYNKVVGGCNNAIVKARDGLNAFYEGGILGTPAEQELTAGYSFTDDEGNIKNRIILNFDGMQMLPQRWKDEEKTELEWNTWIDDEKVTAIEAGSSTPFDEETDLKRRLKDGNIYGGCYSSGIVNGNVVINLNATTVNRDLLFDKVKEDEEGEGSMYGNDVLQQQEYTILERRTGVILGQQGMDALGAALNVFGGGKGKETAIWGSTTINLNAGYSFQLFGGSEEGIIGRSNVNGTYDFHSKKFTYDPKYSCYVNLCGTKAGVSMQTEHSENMAECEILYGGGFLGPICGNTIVNLGKGRIFSSYAGSCNADILGHTETYIGRQAKNGPEGNKYQYKNVFATHIDDASYYEDGFPWIRDYTYGGNDLGGRILSEVDFSALSKIRNDDIMSMVHKKNDTNVLTANAYTEYLQGHALGIFGGGYGTYDYGDPTFKDYTYTTGADDTTPENLGTAREGFYKPYIMNAFVNFRPTYTQINNKVDKVYGAGQGYPGDKDRDNMQDRSYVLIDIPQDMTYYKDMEVFGAGAWSGVGMKTFVDPTTTTDETTLDGASAIIDLVRGQIGAVYGGSYNEGITRRTIINVPSVIDESGDTIIASTIKVNNIFGGAYGTQILPACDVYESHVNYRSEEARVTGAIYGGNNSERRTLYAKINISSPVWSDKDKGYLAKIYGAGKGVDTWSEYTEVNLENGAKVYEVYGGGEMGHVLNGESVMAYMQLYKDQPSPQISRDDPNWSKSERWTGEVGTSDLKEDWKPVWKNDWKNAWTFGKYYESKGEYTRYATNPYMNLSNNGLVRTAEMDDRDLSDLTDEQKARTDHRYNTNVIIHKGATVVNYAYGGGYGKSSTALSGDVYGTTYIALLGGTINKDLYAAGTSGSVDNLFGADFKASANAYIEGGTARNVYGGGWEGNVGYHNGSISDDPSGDILGETHVVIGKLDGTSFTDGIPAIERNAYGGGEGGAVFGTANITFNNGFIGYRHFNAEPTTDTELNTINVGSDYYQEKLHDETWKGDGTNRLYDSGCLFGGGYIDNSNVDVTNVSMYGGHIRNALFGGGEIAAIGRGIIHASGEANSVRTLQGIYKAGKTNVEMFDGHVHRNVFGGGRGYNNLGEGGTLYSDGYVFGQTEVHILGGEIGTNEGVDQGFGNVFGGGDIGYVYSAYENNDGTLGRGIKSGAEWDNGDEGYYYKHKKGTDGKFDNDSDFETESNGEKIPTEDCKVLVEPHCIVTAAAGVDIDTPDDNGNLVSTHYAQGEYVPTSALNTLKNKNEDAETWGKLDVKGIIIHNAVFAGGNTSAGSASVYANATTVFGNATASIHDVYHRDLITIGTGHTGGLYGDGNLTFVDGYRGLNITNYGTDYYTIQKEINIDEYHNLPEREAAYYELRYKCLKACIDKDGTHYTPGSETTSASTITADDLLTLFEGITDGDVSIIITDDEGRKIPNPAYWEENGVCSRYAGRIMNTIQRADFCGVFGSRMVMQGAQDRVPEIVDYTNYTINRVREVSLNQQHSLIESDNELKPGVTRKDPSEQDPDDYKNTDKAIHGNYFGIYNIVNYLGALSSDVHFTDKRITDNTSNDTYQPDFTGQTFYQWKETYNNERKRNNGNSLNKVALASGVYLELTTERSTGNNIDEKDWGYITGIIELDLINVQTGIGGGFVYAKNEHRKWTYAPKQHSTLTALNKEAITRRDFTYSDEMVEWETSGNFVHSTQTIIDDCYNISGKYQGDDAVPAHYWYIKGQVYVYDQYISAYTGAPNAYSETVDIPLTITAASHGTMKLLNVMPNRYAYYAASGVPLEDGKKVIINDITYYKNDPISYWDWYLLSASEKDLFVEETYVSIADCKIGETTYPAGTVLLPAEYKTWKRNNPTVYHVEKQENVDFDFVFRLSNNLSHDSGYILTYKVNNPTEWNTWYTKFNSATQEKQQTPFNEEYNDGPTYRLTSNTGGVLGQREYTVSNVIAKDVYDTYQAIQTNHPSAIPSSGQATFEPAYIVTKQVEVTKNGHTSHLYPGSAVSATEAATMNGSVAECYVCTSTIQLSKTEFIYLDTKMSAEERADYYNRFKDDNPELAAEINANIVPAYYCTKEGLYGGDYYEAGKNYRGLAAWCSMSEDDRQKFTFNYDVLDLLIDPAYSRAEGQKFQYDGKGFTTEDEAMTNAAGYSITQHVDYTAEYKGDSNMTYTADDGSSTNTSTRAELSRTEFERLPNEQRHYAPISVKEAGSCYVVNSPLQIGNTPYAAGTIITSDVYDDLGNDKSRVTKLVFTNDDVNKTFYFCRESYTVGENGEGHSVTNANISGSQTGSYNNNDVVPVGLVISATSYGSLVNRQVGFTIHGIAPTETSTLYVSRNSDIFDLSTEKIITVIYQYDYEENDASGNVTPISERHVVNIHITFKSGVPSVEDIKTPQTVIPGDQIGLREPNVTPGAYEVTGGGWELFEKESDAESHINGIAYTPTFDPLYWYQDGYYVAYYAKTYLGKTYSNHVPVSVANYHDLDKVMNDTEHHYYVDIPDLQRLQRVPKIYINTQEGLDQLSDLFNLSLLDNSKVNTDEDGLITTDKTTGEDSPLKGHALLDSQVKGADNLEFFLHTDIDHSQDDGTPAEWTPIGNADQCFEGTLHGDGHTISGLDNSLIGNLCGQIYNLGVTGSFTGAGVAETGSGYVENCWVKSSATDGFEGNAVFGNPSRTGNDLIQVVNCYYPKSNNYAMPDDDSHGKATQIADDAFYNGKLAYNLNGYYLYKRYCDQQPSLGNAAVEYKYYTTSDEGLSAPTTGRYGSIDDDAKYCSAGYVENRYADGDYIYAGGSVPEGTDARQYTDPETDKVSYYPIWPDDYLFFGQALNYGHVEGLTPQEVPTAITASNRVYRAPAYFRNAIMGVAHFNPAAVFAQTKKGDDKTIAYKDMTAIDFTGYNDVFNPVTGEKKAYQKGLVAGQFYPPLLDDGGLTDFHNIDLTRNLLVYTAAPGTSAAGTTANVVSAYLHDGAYEETDDKYRTVDVWDSHADDIRGHWVQETLNNKGVHAGYEAVRDHFLVDRQDFNAPISYSFDDDHRMWYQREPDTFVDLEKGWEAVSLPFTADIVTTQTKGELTHFYKNSEKGHEYWLRQLDTKGNVRQKLEDDTPVEGVYIADFKIPASDNSEEDKKVTNTFLWDFYYEGNHDQKDMRQDTYQTYYKDSRYYEHYPRLANGTPYIIGFPGDTYYEFDLSGQWKASTTAASSPIGLDESQVITFASATGTTINLSDTETEKAEENNTLSGLTFHPSYLNREFKAGTTNTFTLAADGGSYDKVPADEAVSVAAFRPYFTGTLPSGSRNTRGIERIEFNKNSGSFGIDENGQGADGTLSIYPAHKKIVVTSSLKAPTDVRIVNLAGITIAAFTIEPGETVETRINLAAVYLVQTTDGRYNRKLSVR